MDIERFDKKFGKASLIVLALLIWGTIFFSFRYYGYVQTWQLWQIPVNKKLFLDFRLIPGAAETFRAGLDPVITNPYDPSHRRFNYPKIWYLLFPLGMTQDDTVWISASLIVLFFLVVFIFPKGIRVHDAIPFLGFIFSPACILLYERGNVDLAFFILCGITILTVDHFAVFSAVVLLVASFFKLFPFFGIVSFLRNDRKRSVLLIGGTSIVFLVYVLLNLDSLTNAWQFTERGVRSSYGAQVIFYLFNKNISAFLYNFFAPTVTSNIVQFFPYPLAFALMALMFFVASRCTMSIPFLYDQNIIAFRMGAAIYVGTFFLGNNWDYRLSFLLFTIPQLLQWMFSLHGRDRALILTVFGLMFITCWSAMIYYYSTLLLGLTSAQYYSFDELVNWLLFCGLAYFLFASAPEWVRKFEWLGRQRTQQALAV